METLRYVILTNGLLAVISLVFYLLLRHETFFNANRLALWVGLAGALLLPLLELPDWRPQPIRTAMQRTAQVIVPKVFPKSTSKPAITITFPNHKTYRAFQTQPEPSEWSWQMGVIAVYLFGVLLLITRFGVQLLSLRKLIQCSEHEFYDDFTLVRNETVTSPFSFFDWVVLNQYQHTANELEQILRHERVHVRERHSLDMIGTELVCIVFWFNPAAYLFRYLIHQTLEFRADQAVLAEGVDAKLYQYNLLKVSLATGHSPLTNHFSRSQLKARIGMLNRQQSTNIAWLKYSVIFLTALTVASAFARPQHMQALSKYVPKPLAETITAIASLPEESTQPFVEKEQVPDYKNVAPTPSVNQPNGPQNKMAGLTVDSIRHYSEQDSVRLSPSRYMVYKGDYLYWIVTPKTTFDDFTVMKQEFAKYGHTMQLNEIKYDPLYAYIGRINFTVKRQSGGMTRCEELDDDNKPISTIAGFVGIDSKNGVSGTGGLRHYKDEFPAFLRKTATDDEAYIAQFIRDHRIEYLLQEGNQKFKELGSGSATYPKEFFKNNVSRGSGIIVQPDGSLSVDEKLGAIKVFINNKEATNETIKQLKISQLYSLVKRSQYNPARQESFTSALLIYTTEDP